MVLRKWPFIALLFLLAGYYTSPAVPAPVPILTAAAGAAAAMAGRRHVSVLLLISCAFLLGGRISGPDSEPRGFLSGIWDFRVSTTTTTGAMLSHSDMGNLWASHRSLAGSVRRGDSVRVIGSIEGRFINVCAFHASPSCRIQDRLRRKLDCLLHERIRSGTAAALASALITGERGGIPGSARRLFRRSGTSHLLALSGMHVGIVAGALLLLLRGWSRRTLRSITVILLCGFYVLLSGGRASTARAWIMLSAGALIWRGGRNDALSIWTGTACLMLILSGGSVLGDSGALLSFTAVLCLIVFGRVFTGRAGAVLSLLHAGIVVTAAMAPLVSSLYGGFAPVSPLATAASVPLMLGMMAGGILTLLPLLHSGAALLTEWLAWIWTGMLEALGTGTLQFRTWMYIPWSAALLLLWTSSGGRGLIRRFR